MNNQQTSEEIFRTYFSSVQHDVRVRGQERHTPYLAQTINRLDLSKLTGKLRCQAMERVAGRTGLSVNTAGAVDSSFDLHTHADDRGG